jgi:hypothetical protein
LGGIVSEIVEPGADSSAEPSSAGDFTVVFVGAFGHTAIGFEGVCVRKVGGVVRAMVDAGLRDVFGKHSGRAVEGGDTGVRDILREGEDG